jgi:hypothetical protein
MPKKETDWGSVYLNTSAQELTQDELAVLQTNKIYESRSLLVGTKRDPPGYYYSFGVKWGDSWNEIPPNQGNDADIHILKEALFDLLQETILLIRPEAKATDASFEWIVMELKPYLVKYIGELDLTRYLPRAEGCTIQETGDGTTHSIMKSYKELWLFGQRLAKVYRSEYLSIYGDD